MKAIVITFFSLFITASLVGQTHALGLTSGVNLARTSGYYNEGFQAGPMAGISYQLRFAKKLTFGADLIYDSRGGKGSVTYTTDVGQEIREMLVPAVHQYVSLPLKLGMVSQGKFFGFGSAGIVPSYLLNAKDRRRQPNGDLEWFDLTDVVSAFDVGLLLEGGIGVKLSDRLHIQAAIGGQVGFLNVYKFGIPKTYVHQYAFSGALTCRYTFGGKED